MLTGWRLTISRLFIIPQRYVLGIMGFLAVVNAYAMRVSLNIAITEMVYPISESDHTDPDSCSAVESVQSVSTTLLNTDNLYDWDSKTRGLILGAFYWGYIVTHLPGGMLAEKYGGKYTLSIGILSTAVLTVLTPLVIYASDGNWVILVILRVIVGIGEGTTYPALNVLLAKWIPLDERAKMGSLVYAGSQIGTVFSNLVSGYLIDATNNWASVFYVFGGIGILWFIIFSFICFSSPDDHPFVTDEEKEYLKKAISNVSTSDNPPVPWKAIMCSGPVWALIFGQIGHDWGFYTMVTDLPSYFKDVLKFNIAQNGVWSSLPYIVMWAVSMLTGYVCDWLVSKNYMSVTLSRKFFTVLASIGPAIFIILASYSGCDQMLSVIMFTIGMGLMGSYYCGMKINALDLSPNFAGTLMGIVNGIGAFTGIISPYVAGAVTENSTIDEWRIVFWITFAIFVVTSILYSLFGSGEEQWWNQPGNQKSSEENEANNQVGNELYKV